MEALQTNYITPTVPINLDRERNLRVDFNALSTLEKRVGSSVMNGNVWRQMKARDIRFLLWACLKHEDPKLTEVKAGALVQMGNLRYVMDQIATAWDISSTGGIAKGELKPRPLELIQEPGEQEKIAA